jgi:hypothetical protein
MSNQSKKINLDVRKSRPQTLAAAFGGLLEIFGAKSSDADLAKNWKNIVGRDIYSIANVVAIKRTRDKKFNIVLRPISPAFALELSYKLEDCKKQIDNYYGYDAVSKITIRK